MKLRDFLRFEEMDRPQKRKVLEKILRKLEKKHESLKNELRQADSKKKREKINEKLSTNEQHRKKAEELIAALT